ncbi:MAG: glycosyltransferase, partial [Gammaproteobacteria bacterium]
MDLSIVIVNWNTREMLRNCLQSIPVHNDDYRVEVIVVDNASEDHSGAMVTADFPAVTLIQNTENLGFAKATNQGLRVARG